MAPTPTWKTHDGRRIAVSKLDDDHLANILRKGLRALHRQKVDDALSNLGHAYSGDDGCAYFGDIQYEEDLRRAFSLSHLREQLAKSPRFAPLLHEATRRGLRWTRPKVRRTH